MNDIKFRLKLAFSKNLSPYLFLLPAIILLLFFLIFPTIQAFVYSFTKWDGLSIPKFIGFSNYLELIKDSRLWLALKNNIIIAVCHVSITAIIGFFLAVVIERRIKGWAFFKVAWFIPVMVSSTVVSALWVIFLDPLLGPVNIMLKAMGLKMFAKLWLTDPKVAIYAIIFVGIWQFTGITMLLLLTAMEGIPLEIHDAATVDGVSIWGRMRFIIIPLIKGPFVVIVLLNIISSFKTFDTVWILTRGGPGFTTNVLAVYMYRMTFAYGRYGYGATVAVALFIFVFFISLIYMRFIRFQPIE